MLRPRAVSGPVGEELLTENGARTRPDCCLLGWLQLIPIVRAQVPSGYENSQESINQKITRPLCSNSKTEIYDIKYLFMSAKRKILLNLLINIVFSVFYTEFTKYSLVFDKKANFAGYTLF